MIRAKTYHLMNSNGVHSKSNGCVTNLNVKMCSYANDDLFPISSGPFSKLNLNKKVI